MILSKSNKKLLSAFTLIMVAFTLLSCNATRVIIPLEKGEKKLGISAGGPLVKSLYIPLPLSNIVGAYGIKEHTTGFASLHTTALLFSVLQTDIGITQGIIKQHGSFPAISISPIANLMFERWDYNFRFYPQLDINAYWDYGISKNIFYITLNNWFEPHFQKANQQTQTALWLPSIGIGALGQNRGTTLQVELKYIAPNQSNKKLVVDYIGLGGAGAIGLYLSLFF